MVTIELYGVPRLRAGTGRVSCEATTVGEAIEALASSCPALNGEVIEGGRVGPHFTLSVNGDRFVTDPATPLASGDVVILLSADVGG